MSLSRLFGSQRCGRLSSGTALTPSERAAKNFAAVIQAVSLIQAWVQEAGGADHAIFHDIKVRSAIERQLLVVSEAAIRLDKLDPALASRLAPMIDWPGIRGMGNFIRHKYDDLDSAVVVDVIRNRLDDLASACSEALGVLTTSDKEG
jgi:uncharacterized protein with HEPN domain